MTWIALLRGINVGGRNVLRMSELVALLEALGLEDVRTYVQSGNVVFRAPDRGANLSQRIGAAIREEKGFEPRVLLLGLDELEEAIASNPFPEAEGDPRTLHLHFLATEPADPKLDRIDEARAASERYLLDGARFWLHAPEGIGRSKLAGRIETLLGVAATSRNWRTVTKIRALAGSPLSRFP